MGDKEYDQFYMERFEFSAHFYGIDIIYNATESTYDKVKYLDALKNYTKTATLTTFGKTKIENIINDRDPIYNTEKHPIAYLPGGISYGDVDENKNKNNFYISGFVGNENDPNYIIGNYSLDKDPSSFDKAVFIGILLKLNEQRIKYPATEIHTFLSLLYNDPIEYLGGKMYLLPNHYLSTPFYLVSIKTKEISYTIRAKTTFNPKQYYGKVETEGCNFLESPEDGIETLSYLPIGFVIRMTDYKMKLIRLFVDEMINRFEVLFIFYFYFSFIGSIIRNAINSNSN